MDAASFVACPTPVAWLEEAAQRVPQLLVDHANCEKKAASTALSLLFRYPQHDALVFRMSRLAREELRHFEQVMVLMQGRGIVWQSVAASGYAAALIALMARQEPEQLVDRLIVGALIEARSCERFAALAPVLDEDLATFYAGLHAAEARHYQQYLGLARRYGGEDVDTRIARFVSAEAEFISTPAAVFAFHSGPLAPGTPKE